MTPQDEVVIADALVHQEMLTLSKRMLALAAHVAHSPNRPPLTYRVEITGNWPRETGVTTFHTGSLYEAMRKAADLYMMNNQRTDVQGTYQVWVRLGEDEFIEFPRADCTDTELQIRLEQDQKHKPSQLSSLCEPA